MRSIKVFFDEYTDERNFASEEILSGGDTFRRRYFPEEILSGGDTFIKINNYN